MSKLIRKPTWALFFAHINFLVLIYCISFCFQKLISWFVAFSNSSQNSWIEKVYRLDCLNSDGKPTHLLNRIGLICCSSIRFWCFRYKGIRIAMLKYERIPLTYLEIDAFLSIVFWTINLWHFLLQTVIH